MDVLLAFFSLPCFPVDVFIDASWPEHLLSGPTISLSFSSARHIAVLSTLGDPESKNHNPAAPSLHTDTGRPQSTNSVFTSPTSAHLFPHSAPWNPGPGCLQGVLKPFSGSGGQHCFQTAPACFLPRCVGDRADAKGGGGQSCWPGAASGLGPRLLAVTAAPPPPARFRKARTT